MKTDELMLTVVHQANEARVLTMLLEQKTAEARALAAERDSARAELARANEKIASLEGDLRAHGEAADVAGQAPPTA